VPVLVRSWTHPAAVPDGGTRSLRRPNQPRCWYQSRASGVLDSPSISMEVTAVIARPATAYTKIMAATWSFRRARLMAQAMVPGRRRGFEGLAVQPTGGAPR
jgi:hypothetical protein